MAMIELPHRRRTVRRRRHDVSRYVQAPVRSGSYRTATTNRTKEFIDDRAMPLQPVQLHPDLPLCDGIRCVWLWPVVPLRRVRLQQVTGMRRRVARDVARVRRPAGTDASPPPSA
jgi:hypothetical protein